MAHRYPVECLIRYEEADISTHVVKQVLHTAGPVVFEPDPQRGGRRIHFFDQLEQQQESLAFNPIGEKIFVVPTDVMDDEQRDALNAAIDERLIYHGLIQEVLETEPEPDPDKEKKISPAAVTLAEANGLDPQVCEGSGKDGTVTKGDVERALQQIAEQVGG